MYLLFAPSLIAIVVIGFIHMRNDLWITQPPSLGSYRVKLCLLLAILCLPASVCGQSKASKPKADTTWDSGVVTTLISGVTLSTVTPPMLRAFSPRPDEDGNLEYRVVANKGWDCRETWNPDGRTFALVCVLATPTNQSKSLAK